MMESVSVPKGHMGYDIAVGQPACSLRAPLDRFRGTRLYLQRGHKDGSGAATLPWRGPLVKMELLLRSAALGDLFDEAEHLHIGTTSGQLRGCDLGSMGTDRSQTLHLLPKGKHHRRECVGVRSPTTEPMSVDQVAQVAFGAKADVDDTARGIFERLDRPTGVIAQVLDIEPDIGSDKEGGDLPMGHVHEYVDPFLKAAFYDPLAKPSKGGSGAFIKERDE